MNSYISRNTCNWFILAAKGGRGRWQPASLRGLRPRSQSFSTRPIPHFQILKNENLIGQYSWSLLEGGPNRLPAVAGNDLWEFIRLEKLETKHANGRTPLVILLVTPTYAKSLSDIDPFVPKLLSKIFPTVNEPPKVDVVAAVVDQIPYPPHCYPLPNGWPRGPNGFEGLSVAVSFADVAAPTLWSRSVAQKAPALESAVQPPVLSFRFPSDEWTPSSEPAPERVKSSTTHVVRLPVANTLFYNGQPSTMFASHWTTSMNSNFELVFERVHQMNLTGQTLNMFGRFSTQNLQFSKLVLELQALTVPRIIAAGLGNIIRELYIGKESNETMPASQELEKATSPIFFQNGGKLDERPGAWALIIPRSKWIAEPQIGTSNAAHWIERGSRLYRILSGGGGWGAKKGLLALDPETDFDSPQPKTSEILENDQFADESPEHELEGFFKPGDIVTFFRSKFLVTDEPEKTSALTPTDWHITSPPSVCFGSASPPADIVPKKNTAMGEEDTLFRRIMVKNYFGMISERGIHYRVDREVPADSIEQSGTVVDTRIHNPHARLSIMGRRRAEMNSITPTAETETKSGPTQGRFVRRFAL